MSTHPARSRDLRPAADRPGRHRRRDARACPSCGVVCLDIPDGHDAHQVVFGHRPEVEA